MSGQPLTADLAAALYVSRTDQIPQSGATVQDLFLALRTFSIIKSIQYVTKATTGGGGSGISLTISSVNTSKTVIILNGIQETSSASAVACNYTATLTGATTVTLTNNVPSGGNTTMYLCIVEYY